MPLPTSHLDLVFVSVDRQAALDGTAWAKLQAAWEAKGWLKGSRAGPQVDGLLPGGFARVWHDIPDKAPLYANQVGGFRVRCPVDGAPLAREFGRAVQAWRRGGDFSLACPSCGELHALDAISLVPKGRFARGAIIFSSVEGLDLVPGALAELEAALGPLAVVERRV